MLYAGLDLGGHESHLFVVDGKGKRVLSTRVGTTRESLTRVFSPLSEAGVCVAIEAGGVTRWVYKHLLAMGVQDVYVVNPNKMRLIAESRKKTDKVDARLLAQLFRLDGLPKRVHMPSDLAAQSRMLIKGRNRLVESRTSLANTVRGFLRGLGLELPARSLRTITAWDRLPELEGLDESTAQILRCYARVAIEQTRAIHKLEAKIKQRNREDERAVLLQTIPGVGPQSAAALVAAVDKIERFKNSKRLASYCGLTPTIRNSGDRQVTGHITKQGRSEVRRNWVQAAHVVAISRSHQARPLQEWFERVRRRRGYQAAIIALARRLVTIAFCILRDLKAYDPTRLKTWSFA